jgi:hypothetical protein
VFIRIGTVTMRNIAQRGRKRAGSSLSPGAQRLLNALEYFYMEEAMPKIPRGGGKGR